jgi:uncharacterized membrane protein
MKTSRLEAFSDAVLAIIITIMVLELEVPHEPTLQALAESATGLLTYLLSFVYLASTGTTTTTCSSSSAG